MMRRISVMRVDRLNLCVFIVLMIFVVVGTGNANCENNTVNTLKNKVICLNIDSCTDFNVKVVSQGGLNAMNVNWEVGLLIKKKLEQEYGAQVILVRGSVNDTVGIEQMVKIANKAHCDALVQLQCGNEKLEKKNRISVYYSDPEVKSYEKKDHSIVELEFLSGLLSNELYESVKLLAQNKNWEISIDRNLKVSKDYEATINTLDNKVPVALIEFNNLNSKQMGQNGNKELLADSLTAGIVKYFTGERTAGQIAHIASQLGVSKFSVYYKELGSDEAILGVNDQLTRKDPLHNGRVEGAFYPASVIKLFMAFIVEDAISRKEIKSDLVITDQLLNRKADLKTLLRRMMIDSDNDSFNILLRYFGVKWVNERLERLDVNITRVYGELLPTASGDYNKTAKRNELVYGYMRRGGNSTAREIGFVLQKIYERRVKEKEFMDLYNLMLQCKTGENRIKAVLSNAKLAHKTGSSSKEGVYSDVGIITVNGKAYVLVILTEGTSQNKGEAFIRLVTNYLGSGNW